MKAIKNITVFLVALTILFTFTACDGILQNVLENLPDYEYSEDGIKEATLNFAGIKSEQFNGKVKWKIHYEQGEEGNDMVYTMYVSTKDQVRKVLFEVEQEDRHFAMLKLEQDYFIDYDEKTVSVDSSDLMQGIASSLILSKYCIVEFEEEGEPLWEFVAKRNAMIKNSKGEDIETVEFEYNSLVENEDITMKINFRKTFFIIERLHYEIQSGEESNAITIYMTIDDEVPESIFELPGEDQEFTFIDYEE